MAEERLYQWRDKAAEEQSGVGEREGEEGEVSGGRVKVVGVGSTLWQRRQQQASRQVQSTQQRLVDG